MAYKETKRWRDEHPEKVQEYQRRYYGQVSGEDQLNASDVWTEEEIAMILDPDRPRDAELGQKLGRSILSIQVKRSKEKRRAVANRARSNNGF